MSIEISNTLIEELIRTVDRIDRRLTDVEAALNIKKEAAPDAQPVEKPQPQQRDDDDSLELAIGEYWFAKIGILAFILGMFFLLTQPLDKYPPLLPIAIGYLVSFSLIIISVIWLKSFKYISGFLVGGGNSPSLPHNTAASFLRCGTGCFKQIFTGNPIADCRGICILDSTQTSIRLSDCHCRTFLHDDRPGNRDTPAYIRYADFNKCLCSGTFFKIQLIQSYGLWYNIYLPCTLLLVYKQSSAWSRSSDNNRL